MQSQERDQIVAGLVFAATIVVMWPVGTAMRNKSYGLVLAAIVATVTASGYYAYRWTVRREQAIKEQFNEFVASIGVSNP
jgi:hypothetical protein